MHFFLLYGEIVEKYHNIRYAREREVLYGISFIVCRRYLLFVSLPLG